MGWSYCQSIQTKRENIQYLCGEVFASKYRCVKKAVRGNCLWQIVENTETGERFINLFLMASSKESGWGYKGIAASSGPYHHNCPLSYLDETLDSGGYETAWRERVRQYHADRVPTQTPVVGMELRLKGSTIPSVTVTNLKPLRGMYAGQLYRVPRRMIA